MDKRTIKKSICLVTVWVFLLSQLAYAGIYEDIFGLPSSQNTPTYEGSSDWRNSKVEPLYSPEYQQIEPTLPPADDGEGENPEPTGIWGWLVRNIGRKAKTALETGVKIVLAPLSILTACTIPPQTQPPPIPTLFELPTKLGEYAGLNISVDLTLTDLAKGPLIIKTPTSSVPISFYNNLQFSEELSAYLEAEKNHGKEVTHIVIYNVQLILDKQDSPLVVVRGGIELRGKEGLKDMLTMGFDTRYREDSGRKNTDLLFYPADYKSAMRYIETGLLVGIIRPSGEFVWGFVT